MLNHIVAQVEYIYNENNNKNHYNFTLVKDFFYSKIFMALISIFQKKKKKPDVIDRMPIRQKY